MIKIQLPSFDNNETFLCRDEGNVCIQQRYNIAPPGTEKLFAVHTVSLGMQDEAVFSELAHRLCELHP